jgi:hypothetical protein
MKNRSSKTKLNWSRKYRWQTLVGVVTVTILIVGVVSALSKDEPLILKTNSDATRQQKSRNYVTTNAAGQTIVLDRQTGEQRPLSPQEARTLAEGIKQLLNRSTEGLVQVRHADGMVEMDLQGRFQNVLVAKRESDGTISQSCVDNVDAAAAFFEIDPALVGGNVSKQQPVSSTPAIR